MTEPRVDLQQLQDALAGDLFAPWVAGLGLQLRGAEPGLVRLALPVTPQLVHGGGVVCGQALMAAADTAMVLAVMTRLGGFKPMTTVQLQTSFLRAVPAAQREVTVVARVLRLGRNLVFGDIALEDEAGALAAHATTTYALL